MDPPPPDDADPPGTVARLSAIDRSCAWVKTPVLVAVFGSTKEDETRPLVSEPVAVEERREEQALARCEDVSVGAQEAAVGAATAAAAAAPEPDEEETAVAVSAAVLTAEEDEVDVDDEEKGV